MASAGEDIALDWPMKGTTEVVGEYHKVGAARCRVLGSAPAGMLLAAQRLARQDFLEAVVQEPFAHPTCTT